MPEKRKKSDREFREGAVQIVEGTGKPLTQITRDLGVNEGQSGFGKKTVNETPPGHLRYIRPTA